MRNMWSLQDARASLPITDGLLEIDLTQLARGLHVSWSSPTKSARLTLFAVPITGLANDTAPRLDDAYVRGTNLVATYQGTPERESSLQLCWRAATEPGICTVDWIVSVHTESWHSNPTLPFRCVIPGGTTGLLRRTPAGSCQSPWDGLLNAGEDTAGFVFRSDAGPQFILLASPQDLDRVEAAASPAGTVLSGWLFSPSLEKGVIRRAWMRGILTAQPLAAEALQQCEAAFRQSSPPLTV